MSSDRTRHPLYFCNHNGLSTIYYLESGIIAFPRFLAFSPQVHPYSQAITTREMLMR